MGCALASPTPRTTLAHEAHGTVGFRGLHAVSRKRITKQMVIAAITLPDQVIDSYHRRKLYRKGYERDTLEVVAKEEENKLIIITAYILGLEP